MIMKVTSLFFLLFLLFQSISAGQPIQYFEKALSLEDCIEIALNNNHIKAASKHAVEIAEAQLNQAMSAYWPKLEFNALFSYLDENPNFVIPSFDMTLPALTFPGAALELPPMKVPAQDIKLMDKKNFTASINFLYPVYTGGYVSSLNKQAEGGLEIAKIDSRKTDLNIIYDVKRFYCAVLLTRELKKIGDETFERLKITLELTENLYKRGSGKVKKTDYLRNKVIVEGVGALTAALHENEKLAKAALINALGLPHESKIEIAEGEIPNEPLNIQLDDLITGVYVFNPDWSKLNTALDILEAKIDEAKSGYLPKAALTGSIIHLENPYEYGVVSKQNKTTWIAGFGIELPLFNGFRTKNEVGEARARLDKLNEEKILLKEGLALIVKKIFFRIEAAEKQNTSLYQALTAAEENRELNERAYKDDLAEIKDVIEAQLTEAFVRAQYLKSIYDHSEAQANLEFILGSKVNEILLNKDNY